MTHTFIVNDENNVNEYGYRVMTEGIDTTQYLRNPIVLYMHNRAWDSPNRVVGKAIKLEKKGGQLIAEIEFDESEKTAKELANKVEKGFIKMASFYADVQGTSEAPEDVLPGQTLETVTKSKLVEISIVDVGGNDNALKLSRDGQPVQLNKLNTKTETKIDMNIKTIALSLGLSEDTAPEKVNSEVAKIKLAKEKAEARVTELELAQETAVGIEADTVVGEAIELGLIPEGLKDSQVAAYKADPTGQKVILSKLITDKKAETETDTTHKTVKEVLLKGKGGKGKGGVELSFDYLQKNDTKELRRIRDEEPKEYTRLAKEFGAGKRHESK